MSHQEGFKKWIQRISVSIFGIVPAAQTLLPSTNEICHPNRVEADLLHKPNKIPCQMLSKSCFWPPYLLFVKFSFWDFSFFLTIYNLLMWRENCVSVYCYTVKDQDTRLFPVHIPGICFHLIIIITVSGRFCHSYYYLVSAFIMWKVSPLLLASKKTLFIWFIKSCTWFMI